MPVELSGLVPFPLVDKGYLPPFVVSRGANTCAPFLLCGSYGIGELLPEYRVFGVSTATYERG